MLLDPVFPILLPVALLVSPILFQTALIILKSIHCSKQFVYTCSFKTFELSAYLVLPPYGTKTAPIGLGHQSVNWSKSIILPHPIWYKERVEKGIESHKYLLPIFICISALKINAPGVIGWQRIIMGSIFGYLTDILTILTTVVIRSHRYEIHVNVNGYGVPLTFNFTSTWRY